MSSITISITVTALVGNLLSPDSAFATLPLAIQFTSTMLTTLPASFVMKKIGRRNGFSLGVIFGILGSFIAICSILEKNYLWFCGAMALIGIFMGFSVFYRHAASDTASDQFQSKAISLVIAGGVVSAFIGPELAKWSYDYFGSGEFGAVTYEGCFGVIGLLMAGILVFLKFIDIPPERRLDNNRTGRALLTIARQPKFLIAVTGAMTGYGIMMLIMTAAPLAIINCGYRFQDAAFVIQWHSVAMFAPSFVTGSLILRFGVLNIMLVGAVSLIICAIFLVSGTNLFNFGWGMVLLGIGWNFLFVGGTTLLTECHDEIEKAKVQGLNDFLVFSTVAVASFIAGYIFNSFSWSILNFITFPIAGIIVLLIFWLNIQGKLNRI